MNQRMEAASIRSRSCVADMQLSTLLTKRWMVLRRKFGCKSIINPPRSALNDLEAKAKRSLIPSIFEASRQVYHTITSYPISHARKPEIPEPPLDPSKRLLKSFDPIREIVHVLNIIEYRLLVYFTSTDQFVQLL